MIVSHVFVGRFIWYTQGTVIKGGICDIKVLVECTVYWQDAPPGRPTTQHCHTPTQEKAHTNN